MSVSPVNWLESQFYSGELCLGIPDVIKVFSTQDPTDWHQGNETWPEVYAFQQNIDSAYPYSVCGNLNVQLPATMSCCTSIMDQPNQGVGDVLSGTFKLTIGIMIPWDDGEPMENFVPVSTKSTTYCQLAPLLGDGTVFGYKSLYYRQDGQCKDGIYKCTSSGKFLIYSSSSCSGNFESFDATSTATAMTSTILKANFKLSQMQFKDPKSIVGWTQFIPDKFLVPNFKFGSEVVALILFILCLILNLAGTAWAGYQFYQRRRTATALLGLSQVSFILFICCRMVYIYTVFEENIVMYRYMDAIRWLNNLGSLFTCFYSAEFLLNVTSSKDSKLRSYGLYSIIMIMHLLFAGVKYLYVFIPSTVKITKDPTLFYLTRTGSKNFYIWTLFYFLFDLLPPCFVISYLFRNSNSRNIIAKIWAFDKYFIICLVIQIICAVINYVIDYLRYNTYSLGNDRNWLAATAVLAFIQSFHSVLNGVIVARMKIVMQNKSKLESKDLSTNSHQPSTARARPLSTIKSQSSDASPDK